jgi:hypothetical protein
MSDDLTNLKIVFKVATPAPGVTHKLFNSAVAEKIPATPINYLAKASNLLSVKIWTF